MICTISDVDCCAHTKSLLTQQFQSEAWDLICMYIIGGGGSNPIFPHGKCVFSYFSPWGKMGKKVHGKRGKSIHFFLFPYSFFPIFPHGKKWENTHFSMGKNGIGPPPPPLLYMHCTYSSID